MHSLLKSALAKESASKADNENKSAGLPPISPVTSGGGGGSSREASRSPSPAHSPTPSPLPSPKPAAVQTAAKSRRGGKGGLAGVAKAAKSVKAFGAGRRGRSGSPAGRAASTAAGRKSSPDGSPGSSRGSSREPSPRGPRPKSGKGGGPKRKSKAVAKLAGAASKMRATSKMFGAAGIGKGRGSKLTPEERAMREQEQEEKRQRNLAAAKLQALHRGWQGRERVKAIRAHNRLMLEHASALKIQCMSRRVAAKVRVDRRKRMQRGHGFIIVITGPLEHFGRKLDAVSKARADRVLKTVKMYKTWKVIVVGYDAKASPLHDYLAAQVPDNMWPNVLECADTVHAAKTCLPIVAKGWQPQFGLPPSTCDVVTSDYHVPRCQWLFQRVMFQHLPRTRCRVIASGGYISGNALVEFAHRERRLLDKIYDRYRHGTAPLFINDDKAYAEILSKRKLEDRRLLRRYNAATDIQRIGRGALVRAERAREAEAREKRFRGLGSGDAPSRGRSRATSRASSRSRSRPGSRGASPSPTRSPSPGVRPASSGAAFAAGAT